VKIGPHNTSPPRLRQIADDLRTEGWHGFAGTIDQVADERERAMARPATAQPTDQDDLAAIQILRGEVDSLRAQRDLLDRQNAALKQHGPQSLHQRLVSLSSDAVRRLEEFIEFGMLPWVSAGGGSEVTNDSERGGARDV
jgi:hypothetical protein